MTRRSVAAALSALALTTPMLVAGTGDARAQAGQAPSATAASRAPLPTEVVELRAKDARVLTLGYRLVTGNARFCEDRTYSAGLLLHDMAAYGGGATLRTLLGLTGDIGVQALVAGGPARRPAGR